MATKQPLVLVAIEAQLVLLALVAIEAQLVLVALDPLKLVVERLSWPHSEENVGPRHQVPATFSRV